MAGQDNFKPQMGGLPVAVKGAVQSQGPALGQQFSLGQSSGMPAVAQQQVPNAASLQQTQIGQSNSPKGAQPVSLMGQMPVVQGVGPMQHQQVARMPMAPQAPPANAGNLGRANDGEVHTISVEGQGPDGKKYVAEFDAVFPRGTKVMGVTENVKD